MTKHLIIAKFQENTDWLKSLNDWNIFLYNKDKSAPDAFTFTEAAKTKSKSKQKASPIPDGNITEIILKNVGREAHTYLHHIVANYDNLADVNVFTQAHPFDHCPNFIEKLEKVGKGYFDFGGKMLRNKVDNETVTRAGAKMFDDNSAPIIYDILKQYGNNDIKQQINKNGYAIVNVKYYAIFSADRDTIRKYPKSFYEKMLQLTIESPHGPYIMEFLWSVLYA